MASHTPPVPPGSADTSAAAPTAVSPLLPTSAQPVVAGAAAPTPAIAGTASSSVPITSSLLQTPPPSKSAADELSDVALKLRSKAQIARKNANEAQALVEEKEKKYRNAEGEAKRQLDDSPEAQDSNKAKKELEAAQLAADAAEKRAAEAEQAAREVIEAEAKIKASVAAPASPTTSGAPPNPPTTGTQTSPVRTAAAAATVSSPTRTAPAAAATPSSPMKKEDYVFALNKKIEEFNNTTETSRVISILDGIRELLGWSEDNRSLEGGSFHARLHYLNHVSQSWHATSDRSSPISQMLYSEINYMVHRIKELKHTPYFSERYPQGSAAAQSLKRDLQSIMSRIPARDLLPSAQKRIQEINLFLNNFSDAPTPTPGTVLPVPEPTPPPHTSPSPTTAFDMKRAMDEPLRHLPDDAGVRMTSDTMEPEVFKNNTSEIARDLKAKYPQIKVVHDLGRKLTIEIPTKTKDEREQVETIERDYVQTTKRVHIKVTNPPSDFSIQLMLKANRDINPLIMTTSCGNASTVLRLLTASALEGRTIYPPQEDIDLIATNPDHKEYYDYLMSLPKDPQATELEQLKEFMKTHTLIEGLTFFKSIAAGDELTDDPSIEFAPTSSPRP